MPTAVCSRSANALAPTSTAGGMRTSWWSWSTWFGAPPERSSRVPADAGALPLRSPGRSDAHVPGDARRARRRAGTGSERGAPGCPRAILRHRVPPAPTLVGGATRRPIRRHRARGTALAAGSGARSRYRRFRGGDRPERRSEASLTALRLSAGVRRKSRAREPMGGGHPRGWSTVRRVAYPVRPGRSAGTCPSGARGPRASPTRSRTRVPARSDVRIRPDARTGVRRGRGDLRRRLVRVARP